MTREEAIKMLNKWGVLFPSEASESIDMAIEALQREEAEEKGYCHRIKPKEYFSTDAVPTVIRSKTLMPTKDFKVWAKRIREENPNVIVIPCDAEVVSADSVVRCKDCRHSRVYGKTTQWLACENVMEGQATDPDGYCYLGERREP